MLDLGEHILEILAASLYFSHVLAESLIFQIVDSLVQAHLPLKLVVGECTEVDALEQF